MGEPILHVRAMWPVPAPSAWPPLPPVHGSPGSEYSERRGGPHGPPPPWRSGLPAADAPGPVRASYVLAAALHAYRALGGPRQSLGTRTKPLPLGRRLGRSTHRRLHEPRERGGIQLQGVRSPLRSPWGPVDASPVSCGVYLLHRRHTREEGLVRPCSAGTCTLQETPSFAWRTNARPAQPLEAVSSSPMLGASAAAPPHMW
jgi:hypothetical protein